MPYIRKVTACDRCRRLKRRCDRARPTCSKCRQTNSACSFTDEARPSRSSSSRSSSPSAAAFDLASLSSWIPPRVTTLATPPLGDDGFDNDDGGDDGSALAVDRCVLAAPVDNRARARDAREVRRRNRVRFSCVRCHRMKVKCDKQLPCGRCVASRFGDSCSYARKKGPGDEGDGEGERVASPEPESFDAVFQAFNDRHRGSSHWRILMERIKELTSFDFNVFMHSLIPQYPHCTYELILPVNYPFGSPGAVKFASLKLVMQLLAKTPASAAESYVDSYFRVFEPLQPVFDVDSPDHGVVAFDASTPPKSVGELVQLAQYLTVLGLGCSAVRGTQSHSAEYYLAAEACLMKTPFMFRPTLATIRTLCLMVTAKKVANATCWAVDACWSLVGLMLRLAVMLGLHRNPELEDGWEDYVDGSDQRSRADRVARRRLWTTIVYLDAEIAIITGMPALLRRDDLVGGGGLLSYPEGLDTSISHIDDPIYNAFPVIMDIAVQVNAKADQLTYEAAVHYNATVRQLMVPVLAAASGFRRTALDIFFRRVLLVLHRKFAHHASSPVDFPVCYWSSLECSLALLVLQRGLWEAGEGFTEVSRVFMLDFVSAAMTACIHVLRKDAPLSAAAEEAADGAIPPRQTILETLKACVEIWQRQQDKSPCILTGYRIFDAVIGEIPDVVQP